MPLFSDRMIYLCNPNIWLAFLLAAELWPCTFAALFVITQDPYSDKEQLIQRQLFS